MSLTEVLRSDTFEVWRQKTNTISSDLGVRTDLSANITANTSLVGAINELQGDIGVVGSLSTFTSTDLVSALNELKTGSSVTISGTKTFSSNLNLSSGQAFTIAGTSVLSATTLGAGVINSSLTSVGTIGSGVWQGTIVSPTYGGTGVNNGSRTITVNTGNLALTAQSGGSDVIVPASGTLATLAGGETLTNKTIALGSNTITGTLAQFSTALTDDDFAGLSAAQALTNKTIALGSNSLSGTLAQFNSALTDDDFAAISAAQTLTNKSLQDSTTYIVDETTPSKRLQFQVSGISSSTTRTLTAQDKDGTIAVLGDVTYIGTTSVALGRGSGNLALTGISSITLPGATGSVLLQPASAAGSTTITLPATSGTVVTTGDTASVSNTMLAGSIANAKLANSSITFNGVAVALGGSGTITSTTTNALTIGDGLSGTSFNGSAAVTIAADSTLARRTDTTYIGTTSVALNRSTGNLALTGISSIAFPTAGSQSITLSGALTNSAIALVLPASAGTLVSTGDAGSVTNAMLAGSIANGKLANSSITLGSTSISLGATQATLAGLTSVTSAAFSGPLSGNVTGNLTGNADTATKLATSRTINGVSFDGSANITVTAAAGTLTGTALNSTIVTSSLTSVGTIGAGTWQGSSIATAYTDAKIVSITGTSNQVNVANTSGAVTLSLPQSIAAASTPTFAAASLGNVRISSTANQIDTSTGGLILDSTGGTLTVNDNTTINGTLDSFGKTQFQTSLVDGSIVMAVVNNNATYSTAPNRFTVKTDGTVEIKGDLIVRGTTTVALGTDVSANFNTLTNKPSPVVAVSLSSDVTGSGNTTLTELAGGTYSIAVAATIANNAVTTAKILDGSVTTAKILDANVTNAKLANSSITVTTAGGSGLSGGGAVSLGGSLALVNSDKGSSQNIFKTISVSGSTDLAAGSNSDTLTFASNGTLSITTTPASKTVNIVHATMGSQASVDNSGGTVIQDVTLSNGHVTGLASVNLDTRYTAINTETLDSITSRGSTTTNSITVGGLTVTGTLTYVNSTNLEVTDKNILIGKGSNTEALLNGSGITFGELSSNTPALTYSYTASPVSSKFVFNRNLEATAIVRTGGTSSQFLKADGSVDASTYLTGNQTITLSGAVTGSGTTSIATTLADSGVTAGTYNNVTVNAKGIVTAGSNVAYLTSYTETSTLQQVATRGATTTTSLTAASFVKSGGTSSQFLKADGSSDSNTYLTSYTETSTLQQVATRGATTTTSLTAASFVKSGGTSGQFLKADGSVDSNTYLTTGTAASTYQPIGSYQAADADLTAIAALAGTSGLLRKTAADTWSLDTNAYLTGNQSITIGGDATGSGTTSISLTLANSGVTIGTYNNVTVDVKGRVTSGSNVAYLTSYTETSTLQNVTSRGASTTASITANSFIRSGGTSTQFLKADGSVDGSTYLTSNPNLQTVCGVGSTTTTSITANSFVKSGAASTDILKGDGSTEADSNYVKTSGAQSIGGIKTFTERMGIGAATVNAPLHINLAVDPTSGSTPARGIWNRPTIRVSNLSNTTVEGINVGPTIDSSTWGETVGAMTYTGIRIATPTRVGTQITNTTHGLYLENVSFGTTNYAIYSAHTGASVLSGSLTATSIIKSGGTSSQFLKADGSVDSSTYLTSAVTSITAGTGITVTGTTTPTISIPQAIGTASSVQHGSLGIGTTASGVPGEIRASDNITAYFSSDERLKTNVRKIENALDKVSQIDGVVYDWNDTYKKDHGDVDGYFVRDDNSGVIAQQVEKVFPNVVAERQDGYKAVRYELLVPLLIEAIKDLKAEIEALKATK